MNTTELRTLALALRHRIADTYAALLPAYTEITGWTLDDTDAALPSIAQLKAVYNAFNVFEKPEYRLVEEVRALKATTDDAVTLVEQLAPYPHTHAYTEITGAPTTMPPETHTHVKADVTDFPATFPPETHTHVKADVTDFPATFPPETHTHVKADVTDFPATFPPETHTHVKADVTDFPATMPPAAHNHAYADITGKPTAFPPAAHNHSVTANVRYTGNSAASRVLTLSSAITPTAILIMRDNAGMKFYWTPVLGHYLGDNSTLIANAISVANGTVTLTSTSGNGSGNVYTLIAWGDAS